MTGEELGRIAKALAATKDADLQFLNDLRVKYKLPIQ